jgi:hypothetical protein
MTGEELNPILLIRALATFHGTVSRLLQDSAATQMAWNSLLANLRHLGHDPNRRRRPSVLDTIQGLRACHANSAGITLM